MALRNLKTVTCRYCGRKRKTQIVGKGFCDEPCYVRHKYWKETGDIHEDHLDEYAEWLVANNIDPPKGIAMLRRIRRAVKAGAPFPLAWKAEREKKGDRG